MRNRINIILVIALAVAAACSSSKSPSKPDAKMIDAFTSACGQPGDTGNDKGVGKFCTTLDDCLGNQMATLCSIVGDSTTHFCTTTCTCPSGGGSNCQATNCGMNATCTCNSSNECGCTPNSCL
ncbi:MAG TPA: hypothetical protein VMJ10_35060 [Kofleriaceae bacterium]|nr:hypothetical protein [Kofleriaceae bacterium]